MQREVVSALKPLSAYPFFVYSLRVPVSAVMTLGVDALRWVVEFRAISRNG